MPYADVRKQRAYMVNRRRELKRRAVEYKGGKCKRCGYIGPDAAMTFHHPGTKKFGIADGHVRSWARVRRELDRTEMVCLNCHAEISAEIFWGVAQLVEHAILR